MTAKPIKYLCAKCGATVRIADDGDIDRQCTCNAPILANMSATVTGEGGTAAGGKRA